MGKSLLFSFSKLKTPEISKKKKKKGFIKDYVMPNKYQQRKFRKEKNPGLFRMIWLLAQFRGLLPIHLLCLGREEKGKREREQEDKEEERDGGRRRRKEENNLW